MEAAARERHAQAMIEKWRAPEPWNGHYITATKAILAAYFAALDPEALVRVVEDAIAAPGRVRNIRADETLEAHRAKAVLEALGLFTPDTEEPTNGR